MTLVFHMRQKLSRRAQLCVLPNERRAEKFAMQTGNGRQKTICVWNCPSQKEVSPPQKSFSNGELRLLYHGSIVPSRLPLTLLQALTSLSGKTRLQIIGYEPIGHKGYVQQLKETSRRIGLEKQVEFLGPMPRKELLKTSQTCDVGIAFIPKNSSDINFQNMTGASNKIFDYLACGLAVLVCDLPEWKKAYVEPGYGLACDPDDPKGIAETLRWFLDHPQEMRSMGERGRQRIISEWNYEKKLQPVLEKLNQ